MPDEKTDVDLPRRDEAGDYELATEEKPSQEAVSKESVVPAGPVAAPRPPGSPRVPPRPQQASPIPISPPQPGMIMSGPGQPRPPAAPARPPQPGMTLSGPRQPHPPIAPQPPARPITPARPTTILSGPPSAPRPVYPGMMIGSPVIPKSKPRIDPKSQLGKWTILKARCHEGLDQPADAAALYEDLADIENADNCYQKAGLPVPNRHSSSFGLRQPLRPPLPLRPPAIRTSVRSDDDE
jgi:hypothetical protein